MIKLISKIIFAISILAVFIAGYKYYEKIISENTRLHTELLGKTKEFKKLSENTAKLKLEYTNQKELINKLKEEFKLEKNDLQGRIKLLSNATYLIREKARKSKNSDISYVGNGIKFLVNEVRFNEGPPVGYVLIFDDGSIVSKLYNHEINVKTVVSRDEDSGKYGVISRADYILKSPSINVNGEKNWVNKPYHLKIVDGKAIVDPTEKNLVHSKFHLWAPHINGGVGVYIGPAGIESRFLIDFSIMGLGPTKNDLDWKFLHLGIDSDFDLTNFGIHITPVSYRFFPDVLSNTYIAPSIGWTPVGLNGQVGINVTF